MNCDFNRFTRFKIRIVPEYLAIYVLSLKETAVIFVNVLYMYYSWAQRPKAHLLRPIHQVRQSLLLNLQTTYTKETKVGNGFTNGKLISEQG